MGNIFYEKSYSGISENEILTPTINEFMQKQQGGIL